MIVDHTNRRVLDVLEPREKAAVVKFLRESQETGLLANVIEVTLERWQDKIANYFLSPAPATAPPRASTTVSAPCSPELSEC